MEKLLEYRESTSNRKVSFVLFKDLIKVSGKNSFGSEFETTIPLSTLNPECSITRVYGKYFFYFLILGFLLIAGAVNTEFPTVSEALSVLSIICFALAFLIFGRKITYFHFSNPQGIVLMSVGKPSRRAKQCDEFITRLQEQIRSLHLLSK